jgi:hypothetical protein
MSYEAVQWALYEAPMLRTPSGEPDTTARLVLVARAERADKKGRDTYAGPADVAAATGYDERTVKRADRRLEKAGLMIRDGYSRHGTTKWHLDMSQTQSESSPVDERTERQRKANAERQRRFQDRRRAAAEAGQSIEVDVATKIGITLSNAVSNGLQGRELTPFNVVTNGLHAPQTTHEPPRGTTTETTPGGAPPPDPRRPHSPSAPGTDEQNSLTCPLTPAQDQQGDSLPHARGAPPGEHGGTVVDFFTREAM